MSSNRAHSLSAFPAAPLAALALALTLSACAGGGVTGGDDLAATPTERYPMQAEAVPDQILLAPRNDGRLSPAQAAALAALSERGREAQAQDYVIQAPSQGGEPAYRSAEAARMGLIDLGASPDQVRVVGYDGAGDPRAPIIVGFLRYEAKIPACGESWDNLTATRNNTAHGNFGCAVSANMAAMLADPGDLVRTPVMDAADAARRGVVLGKYRLGEPTATDSDKASSGAIAQGVQ